MPVENEAPAGLRVAPAASIPPDPQGTLLTGEKARRIYFIEVTEIDYLQAFGNYVKIHAGEQEYVRRDTLQRLSGLLAAVDFARISRSTLLNLRRVRFAERLDRGAMVFTLASGTQLVSSRRLRLVSGAVR